MSKTKSLHAFVQNGNDRFNDMHQVHTSLIRECRKYRSELQSLLSQYMSIHIRKVEMDDIQYGAVLDFRINKQHSILTFHNTIGCRELAVGRSHHEYLFITNVKLNFDDDSSCHRYKRIFYRGYRYPNVRWRWQHLICIPNDFLRIVLRNLANAWGKPLKINTRWWYGTEKIGRKSYFVVL